MKNVLPVILLACIFSSCDKVFPNDDIDFMWRLDNVERLGEMRQTGRCWMSIASHIAVFEAEVQAYALLDVSSDSLFFDFSMCADTAQTMETIEKFGLDDLKFKCSYYLPERNKLVLSGDGIVLSFTRW